MYSSACWSLSQHAIFSHFLLLILNTKSLTYYLHLVIPQCFVFSFCSIEGAHRILVATSEGLLYVGNIDPKEGGECKITKEFGYGLYVQWGSTNAAGTLMFMM